MAYVPLHVHSSYSLLDGLGSPGEIVRRAQELGLQAVALTDHGVLYGAIEFYKAAKKAGIKPIIGCEMYIARDGRFNKNSRQDARNNHAIFLAKSNQGYQNLMRLITHAHTEGYYYKPRIDYELMNQYHEGIICLSGCINGEFAEAAIGQGIEAARKVAEYYISVFGKENYYFELQYHPELADQAKVNEVAIKLSKELGIGLVVTGDSHYLYEQQQEAHDALLCIGTGSTVQDTNRMKFDGLFHMHAEHEVAEWFPELPEAIENTQKIADLCNLELELGVNKLPQYETPEGETPVSYLRAICETNYQKFPALVAHPEAAQRLDYELRMIHSMGFDEYFLIVWYFVKFAKDNGILVGPGRGSAAGSLVSYVLGITTINPLDFGLIFERFLNPERISMPDIDLDFAPKRREEVLNYVRNKYGADNVAQIITFGTMKARAALRDVGRVLGMPYTEVDRVAKLVPGRLGITLRTALDEDSDFSYAYEASPSTKKLIDLAMQLEGVTRHASTHACAVVISQKPLVTYTPLQLASKDDTATITQYHMKSIEDLGLLKMDFLGLSNLEIIETTMKIIKRTRNIDIVLESLPYDDPATYALLSKGETTGVFQLESSGMKRYLKELKPTELEDIIAMISLFRPGPMDYIPDYIAGKYGNRKITYLHPTLQPILERTYGIAVYQEQILEMAQKFAGFSLGEADVLRRAIGKKIRKELEAQRDKFIAGAVEKGIERSLAIQVFKFIEPFANYGFNKSHAAGYAVIAYQTAYLKANYPVEFMAALLTSDLGNTDRIAIEIEEARSMGIEVLPPSVNESRKNFTVSDSGKDIRFGLGAIKNLGDGPVAAILEARKSGGAFTNLDDFACRVDAASLNKKVLESLAKSGALDSLVERAMVLNNVDRIVLYAKERQGKAREGQMDLFSAVDSPDSVSDRGLQLLPVEAASQDQYLMWEKELLGLYVSSHPLQAYRAVLSEAYSITALAPSDEGSTKKIGGIIQSIKRITTRSGEAMLFVKVEDITGSLECVVFPKVYKQYAALWREDVVLMITGKISYKEGRSEAMQAEPKLLVESVTQVSLSGAAKVTVHTIRVPASATPEVLQALKQCLMKHRGETSCVITLEQPSGESRKVQLPFGVAVGDALERDIRALLSL